MKHAEKTLTQIVQHCHDSLKRTSGVVMSMAFFDPNKDMLAWLAVGLSINWPYYAV